MEEQNYTSFELSKWLKENGCKLESGYFWLDEYDIDMSFGTVLENDEYYCFDILNDICVKYAKEFFGEEWVENFRFNNNMIQDFNLHSFYILLYLQEGKKQEAEEYIKEHCLFNKNNK